MDNITTANKIINLYYVFSIALELMHNDVVNRLEQSNISMGAIDSKYIRHEFKYNHKRIMGAMNSIKQSLNVLGEDYTRQLSIESFDQIREDANSIVRIAMRACNICQTEADRKELEEIMQDMQNQKRERYFSEYAVRRFTMK